MAPQVDSLVFLALAWMPSIPHPLNYPSTPQILLLPLVHAVYMASRPAILDSRILRAICPLQRRSRHLVSVTNQSTLERPWSHPPASVNIDNDQVARLASRPLHPLTLADLVRYQSSNLPIPPSRILSNC